MTRGKLVHVGLAAAALVAIALAPARGDAQVPRVAPTPAAQRILKDLHPAEVSSLRGVQLDSMAVVGEAVADSLFEKSVADSAASAAGLTGAQIEALVADALGGSEFRVRVRPTQQWHKFQPFLKVKVLFGSGTAANGPYVGLMKLALTQPVARLTDIPWVKLTAQNPDTTQTWALGSLNTGKLLYVETWHTQVPFNTSSRPTLRQDVKLLVTQRFLPDYRQANPRHM